MKKVQQGFTLIELMIVVVIIGILAAIAIPAYQDYIARSQASEAVNLTSGLKATVADIYANQGVFTNADTGSQGIPAAASITGTYTQQVAVADGVITATMKGAGSVASGLQGTTIVLTSDVTSGGSIQWTCTGGTMPAKFRPSNCRP